jgi:hypothetical protein
MRVISQDGTKDFPYDSSSVSLYAGCINGRVYVRMQICGYDDSVDVADYSTKEKAKKAMEELRYAYMCHTLVKIGQTPPDGIDEKLTMGLSGVFHFPAEEELE